MRKHEKKQLIDFINSIIEGIDYVFSNTNQLKNVQQVLSDCYSGIVFIEGFITNDADISEKQKYNTVISELKNQFIDLNKLLANDENCRNIFKPIKRNIVVLDNLLKNEKPKIEAVFMPYKASMWDSLESIWLAADKDENCTAVVMPIPYFNLQNGAIYGDMNYEGENYPDYVPITNYNDYDLSEHMPDIIFIHNPYDNCNTVTSVHPMFYSSELKKYTDMLVYVPYFVLSETEPDDEKSVEKIEHFMKQPALVYCDKAIVQSDKMRKIYVNKLMEYTDFRNKKYWNDKILGLGSPKYDRLLKFKKEDFDIPDEWINTIKKPDGTMKKVVLYNTCVSAFLDADEKYFEKMRDVFQMFRINKDDIVLFWRPHPIMMETINSMRPHLLEEYKNIINEFKNESEWIYDNTTDIDRAIILSDAYYGDYSSVVMLYKRTGKPIMIQQIKNNTEESDMEYIIVQAGGKGTRLGYLTANKPKALVPVENLPMIFHLFRKYPDKKFIIIADYKKEVLHEYLAAFADVKYLIVDANGTGTCAGLKQAIKFIPENKSFMLIWSDLILPDNFSLPEINENYIGISQTFQCRWSYIKDEFFEEKSYENGVAGFFLFKDKSAIKDVPESGELVRWMKEKNMKFTEIGLAGTKEFGILEEYNKLEKEKCRPFNKITVDGDIIIKEGIDKQGKKLAERECRWYYNAMKKNSGILPKIYEVNPLKMEFIKGKNIYEYDLPYDEKKAILKKLVSSLKQLHDSEKISADLFSIKEAYFNKTMQRIEKVRDMIPFADKREIIINGKKCRNVYFYKRELEKKLENINCPEFCFIHGDCTFSNMMLRDNGMPVLIDPRGYFGFTELYGDELYDWSKLYYSIVGNYDMFNLKKFKLNINENDVTLEIESNNWEDMEKDFFEMTGVNVDDIKLMHAVIWLSLTTYAWQDYDSICGAFYNGLQYLEDVL